MTYTMSVTIDTGPADAEARIREALTAEGFGILSEIDIQTKLQEKLGEDVGPYKVLGACSPPLAHQALQADPDIGALLPCNVVVRAGREGGSEILAADPEAMLSLSDADLHELACDAKERIRRALDAVAG